jgi:hypothetical protein
MRFSAEVRLQQFPAAMQTMQRLIGAAPELAAPMSAFAPRLKPRPPSRSVTAIQASLAGEQRLAHHLRMRWRSFKPRSLTPKATLPARAPPLRRPPA